MTFLKQLDFGFKVNQGAPNPIILSSENKTILFFYIGKYNLNKVSFPMERDFHEDKQIVALEFNLCYKLYFGEPSQDEIGFHRYAKLGLKPYNYYEIIDSDWIVATENTMANSIIELKPLQHFLFSFHDSTFECLCRGYKYEIMNSTISDAIRKYSLEKL